MPQRKNSSEPPKVMTWGKASLPIAFAAVFDALRLMFEFFWFFGPALAGLYCTVKGGGGAIVATVCGTVAGAAGFVGAPAIEAFGVVMAMATGFAGWLVVGGIVTFTNRRIITENAGHALWFVGSLLISEIPIVGSFPALTSVVVKMYATQIKNDAAALKKYVAERSAEQTQARNERAAQLMQMQSVKLASTEVY